MSLSGEVWARKTSLTPPPFIEILCTMSEHCVVMLMCVRGINFALFYDFSIEFWKCVALFLHHFIHLLFDIWIFLRIFNELQQTTREVSASCIGVEAIISKWAEYWGFNVRLPRFIILYVTCDWEQFNFFPLCVFVQRTYSKYIP